YAVYKAIVVAGFKPEYLDIAKGDLNFSAEGFEQALQKNPEIKVLMVQNTLGFACEAPRIAAICRQQGIILIEDLAHSAGARYFGGGQAGTVGDFAVLSFSQDKMIDAVSGGALIIRNKKYQNVDLSDLGEVKVGQRIMDRWYPMLTFKIRTGYSLGLGKTIHKLYKILGLLSQPMGSMEIISLHKLPAWYCAFALREFQNLENNLRHRREIAKVYAAHLNPKILFKYLLPQISGASNLRFPILVEDRAGLVGHLKNYGIHISDIWYDAPVAPEKYLLMTDYHGQCQNAELVSKKMLNLPTHININSAQAKNLAEKINQWLQSA
ncbi:MAG: DegT/DnrJ/EryC1/StrS family aminotransferase, partial [Candidatus Paceibacterales bacterium]